MNYIKFKNFSKNDVVMRSYDGHEALVTAGSIVSLPEKFDHEIDHSCIRQLTAVPPVASSPTPEQPAAATPTVVN